MSQINFSEIVGMLDGNGFTKIDAMKIAVRIVGLADKDDLWLRGLALQVAKCKDFKEFNPQNSWQRQFTKKFTGLSCMERQCYLLSVVQGYSRREIQERLNISEWAVRKRLENAALQLRGVAP